MKTEKKKFFFGKNEKSIESVNVLVDEQMRKILGGNKDKEYWRESTGGTYSESTYVRR